jgi:hypothetical protein
VEEMKGIESVVNKQTYFVFDPDVRATLGHAQNHLNFREIMDQSKVLIVNLRGLSHTSQRLIGSLITAGFEYSARTRPQWAHPSFYLYLDEFHEFCANSGSSVTLANVLSGARKFGLHLVLAHQYMGQLDGGLEGALNNVRVKISFKVEHNDAKALAHRFYVGSNLPTLDYLASRFQDLKPRQMLVKVDDSPTAFVATRKLKRFTTSLEQRDKFKLAMVKVHGVVREPVKPRSFAPTRFVTKPKRKAN